MHRNKKHVKQSHNLNPNPEQKPVRTLDSDELRQVTGGLITGPTIPKLDGSGKDTP
jgi:hypothetical protein